MQCVVDQLTEGQARVAKKSIPFSTIETWTREEGERTVGQSIETAQRELNASAVERVQRAALAHLAKFLTASVATDMVFPRGTTSIDPMISIYKEFLFFDPWLESLYARDREGDVDGSIDAVYERFMDLLEAKDAARVEVILERADVAQLCVETALAMLAITVPVRGQILARSGFLTRVREALISRRGAEDTFKLLLGL